MCVKTGLLSPYPEQKISMSKTLSYLADMTKVKFCGRNSLAPCLGRPVAAAAGAGGGDPGRLLLGGDGGTTLLPPAAPE